MEMAGIIFISTVGLGLSAVPLYLPYQPKDLLPADIWFPKERQRKAATTLGFYYAIPPSGGSFLFPPVEVNKWVGGPRSVPQSWWRKTQSPQSLFSAKTTSRTQCIFVQVTKRHSTLADERQKGPFLRPMQPQPGAHSLASSSRARFQPTLAYSAGCLSTKTHNCP